ncbi:MAG: hypothetical protein U9R79_03380 [Armatimonadota bacterium]|nr:hypothetical protein [Armatimonadota bacterium]
MSGSQANGDATAVRGTGDRSGHSWEGVAAPHPGIRDPRSRRPGQWAPLTDAIIISIAAMLVFISIWAAHSSSPFGRPRSWERWRADDVPVSVWYPAGWRVIESGRAAERELVALRSEWVRMHLIVAEQEAGFQAAALRYDTLEMAHRSASWRWEVIFGEISEGQPGRTVIGGRPAVWSQFSFDTGFLTAGEPMTGYRATVASPQALVLVAVVAPRRYWERFRPTALDIIGSVRIGAAG